MSPFACDLTTITQNSVQTDLNFSSSDYNLITVSYYSLRNMIRSIILLVLILPYIISARSMLAEILSERSCASKCKASDKECLKSCLIYNCITECDWNDVSCYKRCDSSANSLSESDSREWQRKRDYKDFSDGELLRKPKGENQIDFILDWLKRRKNN